MMPLMIVINSTTPTTIAKTHTHSRLIKLPPPLLPPRAASHFSRGFSTFGPISTICLNILSAIIFLPLHAT